MSWYTDGEAILEKQRLRVESMAIPCSFCHEPAGFPCRSKADGHELESIPAHPVRLKEAKT